MKTKNLFYLILSIIFIGSCGGKDSQEQNPYATIDKDGFRVYPLNLTADKKPLKELIESVEFIRLEETGESLLSFIRSLKWIDNQFYLLGENEVFIFDEYGRFKERFSRQGEGPEEHGNLSGFWVNNDELYLYGPKRVYHYDARRNHVATHRLDFHNMTLIPFRDGFVGNTEGYSFGRDTTFYRITKYDNSFEPIDFLAPYPADNAQFSINFGSVFKHYKDGLTFIPSKNDTLFWYTGDEVQPLMKFDFGNRFFWDKDLDTKAFERIMDEMKDDANPKVMNVQFVLQDEWAHLNLLMSGSSYTRLILNRRTGKHFRLEFPDRFPGWNFREFYQEQVGLVTLPSDRVYDLIGGLDETQYSFREGTSLEEIESSENSVIAWVKFKMP